MRRVRHRSGSVLNPNEAFSDDTSIWHKEFCPDWTPYSEVAEKWRAEDKDGGEAQRKQDEPQEEEAGLLCFSGPGSSGGTPKEWDVACDQ